MRTLRNQKKNKARKFKIMERKAQIKMEEISKEKEVTENVI